MGWLDGIANFASTLATNAQNRDLTQQQWARDDSSHQRAVADMRRAGINPILAAGAGAQSSAPIAMQAPNTGGGLGGDGSQIVKMITAKNNINQSNMQTAIMKNQEKASAHMEKQALWNANKAEHEADLTYANAQREQRVNRYAFFDGIANPYGKTAEALDMLRAAASKAQTATSGIAGDNQMWQAFLQFLGVQPGKFQDSEQSVYPEGKK